MMRRLIFLALPLLVLAQACSFNRTNVSALVDQQNAYYGDLRRTLSEDRAQLQRGLELQVKTSRERRENLAEWEFDLQKAEVLLQVDPDVSGNQRLLSYKLAEIDLAAAENGVYDFNEAARAAAIVSMYDKVIVAIRELEKNSAVLAEYFAASDEEFALRNLDIDGIVRAAAGIRDVQETLAKIEERTDEDKRAEQEKLQKSIERARDVLLRVFEAQEGGS